MGDRYTTLFSHHADYEAYSIGNYPVPNVSHCIDTGESHYTPEPGPLVCWYHVTEDSHQPIRLYYYHVDTTGNNKDWEVVGVDLFDKILIDGVEASIEDLDASNGRVSLEVGDHEVEYFLKDQTTIHKDLFWGADLNIVIVPYGVETIDEDAFVLTYYLEYIYLPETIKLISDSAFNGSNVKSVVIPDSVEQINNSAFFTTEGLQSIHIGKNVSIIDQIQTESGNDPSICEGCRKLARVTVDPLNETFDSRNDCNAIIKTDSNVLICGCMNTVIPDDVVRIGDCAFECKDNIYSIGPSGSEATIEIPSSVTSIGWRAFSECYYLKHIVLPDTVTSMYGLFINETTSDCVFQRSYYLEDAVMPKYLTRMEATFYECEMLKSVTLPSSLVELGKSTFYRCFRLRGISLPDTLTTIGSDALKFCFRIDELTIPAGVTSIGANAFNGMYLTKLTNNSSLTDANNWGAIMIDEVLPGGFGVRGTSLYRYKGTDTIVTIPSTITEIYSLAFNEDLRGMKYIDGKYVREGAVKKVTIPSSVTSIGSQAFYSCSDLTDIYIQALNPPTLANANAFNKYVATIHVPSSVVQTYKTAPVWNAIADRITSI